MKWITLLALAVLLSCNNEGVTVDKVSSEDTVPVAQKKDTTQPATQDTSVKHSADVKPNQYANERFRNVTVEKLDSITYRVKGQGQIFEASFGWVIEDGHNELSSGFEQTDAGAPEWGDFNFTVKAKKARPNSTLHLILYETSAKDGSRVYELPIVLK